MSATATPPARYDLPWKAALSHAFRPFLDFYFPDLSGRVDWRQRPRSRDKELTRLGLGSAPDVMVADKLVQVRLRGAARQVLIHVEIQAQHDAALPRRMHDYYQRIREAYRLPVISLALLADEHPHWRPAGFHEALHGTVMKFDFRTAKLLDYATDIDALEASDNPIAWVTQAHALTQQAHHDANKLYSAKRHLTRLLFQHGWREQRIIVLIDVINWMMTLPESYERRYLQELIRLAKGGEMKKVFNPLEQMLINDGIKIGLEQGRKEGAAALLERLLAQRFGPLPKTVSAKLANANLAQVEAWTDAMSSAQSLKQVFK